MDRATKQSSHQFNKIFFHISKCLAGNAEKTLQLKITKKRMNIANFINIYIQIYKPILYVTRMTQNKHDSINSLLQHGRVVDNNFKISIFDPVPQIVQMEGSYHLLSYKD